jgi:fatty acid desaturase
MVEGNRISPPWTNDDHTEKRRAAGSGTERDPKPLRPRTIGLLMLFWTALMTGWFLSVAAGGSLSTPALALAVGGLIGVIWLLGLLVLGLLLVTSGD